MKNHAWTALVAATACAWAIGTAAQTPAQTSASPTQADSQSATNAVTVTGCLLRATASGVAGATGTSGTVATAAPGATAATATPDPHFILIAIGSAPAPAPTTTAGSVPVSATIHRLHADDAKLAGHVGEKVEITGTLDTSSPTGEPTPASTAGTAAAANAKAPRLKVDSVRTVSATCAQ
jgi:hypothetical protein